MSYRTPHNPGSRPDAEGPDSLCVADHTATAAWLGHVEAGRVGKRLAASDAIKAIHAANERLICGDGTLPIW